MRHRKAFSGFEVKDATKGEVSAKIATLNVKDRDGDVVLPGFFEQNAPAVISAYGHKSWEGVLPVGRGTISTSGDEAVFDGRFFMDTTHGRDTFLTVKEVGDLQEWSWSYDIHPGGATKGDFEGEKVRFLGPLEDGGAGGFVKEVSPVLVGSSIGSATLGTKAHGAKVLDSELEEDLDEAGKARYGNLTTWVYVVDHDPEEGYVIYGVEGQDRPSRYLQVGYSVDAGGEPVLADGETEVEQETSYVPAGKARTVAPATSSNTTSSTTVYVDGAVISNTATKQSFATEADHALASVDAFVTRARSLADLRLKEGRVLSAATRERLSSLRDRIASLAETTAEIERLLAESDPQKDAKQLNDMLLREAMQYERFCAAL